MAQRDTQRAFAFKTWGGARAGAGRPPKGVKAQLAHARRQALTGREPVHVTVRVVRELEGLRQRGGYADVQGALATQLARSDVRICHTSIQRTHLHLIVEADDAAALGKGMRGFLVALARRLNARAGRTGRAFDDRYHAAVLRTPTQVRHALSYVLNNWRKHQEAARPGYVGLRLDPYSSAIGFAPWLQRRVIAEGPVRWPREGALPVAYPQSWLLSTGWRRGGGDISWFAVPAAQARMAH